jgi:hypothetical protein
VERWQALEGGPLMIVIGEVLLVVCSLSYLVWWTVAFRPSVRTPPWGGFFLLGAVVGGLGGVVLLAVGIAALLREASLPALGATIVGGGLVGALLFYVTSGVAHRPVTTELPLIVVWATAQLAAGITLWSAGELRAPAASGLDRRDRDRDAGRARLLRDLLSARSAHRLLGRPGAPRRRRRGGGDLGRDRDHDARPVSDLLPVVSCRAWVGGEPSSTS